MTVRWSGGVEIEGRYQQLVAAVSG